MPAHILPTVVHATGLFDWVNTQTADAKTAILSVSGLALLIVALVILIRHHHSIGKLLGGVVILVIGAALITGGIVNSLGQKVTEQVNNGAGASYSITQQL